jgi:hypothetical protein
MAEHEEITFEEELRKAIDQEPFRPFTIKLTSGDRYRITDPGSLALGTNVVSYVQSNRAEIFFRKNQMVSIEVPLKDAQK